VGDDPKLNDARAAQAGRQGEDVRSDCFVRLEILASGGRELRLHSKVRAFYGRSITESIEHVLDQCGVQNARLEIEDTGAVPFVLMARIEAALRRAGVALCKDPRPQTSGRPHPRTARDRLRRSRLYLPGNEPKFMLNAGLHSPDAVILDLEDSVHPSEKDTARLLVRNALRCVEFGKVERMVRINPLPMGLHDLELVVPEGPDLILIPKVEGAETVEQVDARIREIQTAHSMKEPIWLMPILETALGIEHAFSIARASERVVALTIGLEDYTADLGVIKTAEGEESLWARQRLVNAAHAARVQAIDSVYGDVADEEGLLRWAERSRRMGFEGMGCIHPRQIRIIHRGFAPSDEELEKARRIVEAFELAKAQGRAVVALGNRMIDPPVVLRAQRLVQWARRSGQLDAAEGEQA